MGANKETTLVDSGIVAKEQKTTETNENNDSINGDSFVLGKALDKRFVLNEKTNEMLTGLELRELANKGKLARDLQSKLDKTTAENKAIAEENARLKAEREQLIVKSAMADVLKQGKPTQQTDDSESDGDFLSIWDTDEEATETKPSLRNRKSESSSQIPNEMVNEIKALKGDIEEIKTERKLTAEQSELQKVAFVDDQRRFVSMKTELPDIDDGTIKQIIETEKVAERLRLQSMEDKVQGGDDWSFGLEQADQYRAKARSMYAKAIREQEIIGIRKESDTSLEGSSLSDSPLPEGFKFSNNPEKAKQQWDEIEANHRKKAQLRRRVNY